MSEYRNILFDWDGTIAKTLDVWNRSLKSALTDKGIKIDDNIIGADYINFRKQNSNLEDIDSIIEQALNTSSEHHMSVELYPDAKLVLEKLHSKGKQLALVTSSLHSQINPLLDKFDMKHLFDVVVCGDDTIEIKPSPEPIKLALDKLNAKKSSAIMIGDSVNDIIAANKAGINTVLFYPKSHSNYHDIEKLKIHNPNYIVESFTEILDLLTK
jgi:HAD superfamily hydrolase (TIGR01509 family)